MSAAASEAPRLMAVVVFPTPPFWLAMAMTFPMELTLQDFGLVFHVEQSRKYIISFHVELSLPHRVVKTGPIETTKPDGQSRALPEFGQAQGPASPSR